MKKRTISLLLAAALVVSALSACSSSSSSSESTTAAATQAAETEAAVEDVDEEAAVAESSGAVDSIVIALNADVDSMDPYRYDVTTTNLVMFHFYEPLIAQNPDMSFAPGLAESWETSDDGLEWTFHIREGVKFHDGSDLTADDVVASIEVARDGDSPSAYSDYCGTFDTIEATDDHTVVITTTTSNPLMLFDLSNILILKAENIVGKTEEEIGSVVCGTGRYKFVEHVNEDHIDMVANEDYWGEVPEIKNVRFRPISNDSTRTATMLTGDIDLMLNVPVYDIDRLKSTDGINIIEEEGLRCIYLNFDSREDSHFFEGEKNPMSDVRVREAMYHAIDADTIVKNIMNNAAFVANSYIPEGYIGYRDIERPAYDPDLSIELLTEAGYPDGFEVTLDAPNDRYVNDGDVAQAIAGYLEKVGITVNLNLMPQSTFFTHIKVSGDESMMLMTGWSDASGDGLSIMNDMLHSYDDDNGFGSVNRGHYSNSEVDALVEQGFKTMDDDARDEIVAEAMQLAIDDYAYIPIHFEQDTYAIKDTLDFTPRKNQYVFAWEISAK